MKHFLRRILTLRSEFFIISKSLKTVGEAFRSAVILLILACMNPVIAEPTFYVSIISTGRVTGLKILGSVDTSYLCLISFSV